MRNQPSIEPPISSIHPSHSEMEGGPPPPAAALMGLDAPARHPHQQQQRQLLPFSIAQPHDAPFPTAAYGAAAKPHPSPEEDPREQEGARRGASPSPWQRMKWTDGMVRLLIMIVYSMGDDAAAEPDHPPASSSSSGKARKGEQKKGKWKSVSRAMMEKGFFVSPQQCEDKFNDLNKRYKRVNDLLGKGIACRVVENQALLDTMDHLHPKAKEEARKLLNSKHLFFREMCAYHHSGATAAACAPLSTAPPHHHHHHPPPPPPPHPPQHATSFHDADSEDEDLDDDDDDLDDDDPYDDDDDEVEVGNHRPAAARKRHQHHEDVNDEDEEDSKGLVAAGSVSSAPKRAPQRSSSASPPLSLSLWPPPPVASSLLQQFRAQLAGLAGRDDEQQRQWMKRKSSELEEQRVAYQGRALHLERQRLKWLRFSGNKEREMERLKMENDRLRLENDRMLLLLRHKELDMTAAATSNST